MLASRVRDWLTAESCFRAVVGGTVRPGRLFRFWGGQVWGGQVWGGQVWGGQVWGGQVGGGWVWGGWVWGGWVWGGLSWSGPAWSGWVPVGRLFPNLALLS